MKIKLKLFLIRISMILSLICFITSNSQHSSYKPRRKLISAWADKLIQFFDLDKNTIEDDHFRTDVLDSRNEKYSNNNCSKIETFDNYFLNVYAEKSNMTGSDLDNMIKHQLKGAPKDKITEYKSKKHGCNRKKVLY
jgi:hypothetical protein